MRILAVVEDPGTRSFVRRALEERYRVDVARDGEAALEAIRSQAPDLVLIARMQAQDGLGLLRRIRSAPSTSAIPVVLLAARDAEDSRIQAFEARADDYLAMPVSSRELLARVGSRLGMIRIRRDEASRDPTHAGEARFRTLMSQSRDGIIIIDGQGTILEWNEGEESITGVPRAEAVSRPIWEVQHRLAPEERKTAGHSHVLRDIALGALKEGVDLERTIEEEIQRPDGTRRIIESKLFAVRSDGDLLAAAITRDITDRKRLEEDRREGQALLLEAERLVQLGHFDRDLRTGKGFWSDEVYRILGHEPGSLTPDREILIAAIAPEDRQRVAEALSATVRDGVTRRDEFRIVTPRGEVRTLFATVELLRDAGGAPARIIGTVQDMTDRKRTEDALRESEERFRTMADSAPVMIWVSDRDGNNLFVNRAYCEFFATTVAEVEGSRWQPLVHPDDAEAYIEGFRAAMRGRKAFRALVRVRRRDGAWRWLESHGVLRFAPSGDLLGMVGISTDVTESKLAEEALERSQQDLRNAQRVARVGSWRINVRGDALDWSEETYRIFGIAPGTRMTYATFLAAVHPDDRDLVNRSWQAALEGQPYDVEHRIVASGDVKWVREVAQLEFDSTGALRGGFGTAQDITDRKLMEQALADANRRKDEFLAVLSHELRNPLAPVRSSLYVLARAEPGGEQAGRMLAIIERQVSHLTRLVDDLLDVTRISRGKIQLQRGRVELGELVRRTVEDHRSTFTASGIRLEGRVASSPMWLSADGTRLAQVVGNLLGNAAKFTPRGGRVDLSLEQEGASAVVTVRDTGVGITREMLGRLFEPFMQADRTLDRARGGLGLGLALVKGLAELHGGSVTATSEGPGRGAEFVVRLPLSPATEMAVANDEPARVTPRRVLIIEDNIDAAGSLKEALELDGHTVDVAYTGPEGLTKARAFQPEVVLCDIGLPGMDGYDVARALRADDALDGAFLVALSGYALPEDLQRAKEAGFERHLAKPPTFEELSELLEEAGEVVRGGVRRVIRLEG